MKKRKYGLLAATILLSVATGLVSCGGNDTPTDDVEDYYSINVSSIRTEMLVGSSVTLEPTFTNLGEPATPAYSVVITRDGSDVTSEVYNADTKVFNPQTVGSYEVTFTVLGEDGEPYTTSDGTIFETKVAIEVVVQSFEPRDSAGPDVTVSSDGVLTFGDSYSAGSAEKIDSFQYKVTGVTFEGSYSITYELKDIVPDSVYEDSSLYFGWVKDWEGMNDDSIKLSTKNGKMAAWVWDEAGNQADLSTNRTQGWSKANWRDAPGSVSDNAPLSGDHTMTFERYVNSEAETAVYGILFDGEPFTYLNVGSNYSDVLTNVWVESNNTSGSISVKEFKSISDNSAPEMSLVFNGEYYAGDPVNLNNGTTITDDTAYGEILIPTYKVTNESGDEFDVVNGIFTPTEAGTYHVEATVSDLAMNTVAESADIVITDAPVYDTVIDLSETSAVALPGNGIVLYYSITNENEEVGLDKITVTNSEGVDVTESTIFEYAAKTNEDMKYTYFKAPTEGTYTLKVTATDGVSRTKEINVSEQNQVIYGFTYYELSSLVRKDKIIVGKDMLIFDGVTATDGQTVKIAPSVGGLKTNWKIEFDITDLSYVKQGKMFITKNTKTPDGTDLGWEDLTIGGNVKADGSPDLWGYECNVLGTGWVSYQWRSNWQEPITTEFMPNPNDPTKGCGRPAEAYSQYAVGTHHYTIECTTDGEGNVTYNYYIDNELEVVHHTADAHDNGNSLDFMQFSSEGMNGIVSNIKIS